VNKISRRWWFFAFLFAVLPQVGLLGQRSPAQEGSGGRIFVNAKVFTGEP